MQRNDRTLDVLLFWSVVTLALVWTLHIVRALWAGMYQGSP